MFERQLATGRISGDVANVTGVVDSSTFANIRADVAFCAQQLSRQCTSPWLGLRQRQLAAGRIPR
jgi:hypothetical protein